MTITKICSILRNELFNTGYKYGFIANGKRYQPDMSNGFDKEYYQNSLTIYRVQDPSVTRSEKIGTCIETVVVIKQMLYELHIPCKLWLLHNKTKNKVHTIPTFEAEGKVVYLELTPQSAKPWYGKEIIYDNEQEFLDEHTKNNYDVSDITDRIVLGEQPHFLLEKLQ
jgi:hypothetical protein